MNCSSVEAKNEGPWANDRAGWSFALSRMEEALNLLDESDAPAHIGAQLDLAIQQLRAEIAQRQDK